MIKALLLVLALTLPAGAITMGGTTVGQNIPWLIEHGSYTATGTWDFDGVLDMSGATIVGAPPVGTVIRMTDAGDNVVIQSTMTIQGNAFSVGVSTLVVKDGRVGIGTTNPGAALDVSGDVLFGGRVNGVLPYGAKTTVDLQALACPVLPCKALNTSDNDVYTATGTVAGQWRNSRLGTGPGATP